MHSLVHENSWAPYAQAVARLLELSPVKSYLIPLSCWWHWQLTVRLFVMTVYKAVSSRYNFYCHRIMQIAAWHLFPHPPRVGRFSPLCVCLPPLRWSACALLTRRSDTSSSRKPIKWLTLKPHGAHGWRCENTNCSSRRYVISFWVFMFIAAYNKKHQLCESG